MGHYKKRDRSLISVCLGIQSFIDAGMNYPVENWHLIIKWGVFLILIGEYLKQRNRLLQYPDQY